MAVDQFGRDPTKKQNQPVEKQPVAAPADDLYQPKDQFGVPIGPAWNLAEQLRKQETQKQQSLQERMENLGKGQVNLSEGMVRRAEELELGRQQAKKFFETPETAEMEKRLRDLAKGFGGEELGAMRQEARGQIAGAQKAQQRQFGSQLGKSGVSGARAAAMKQAARQEQMRTIASSERQMLLNDAAMKAEKSQNLVDFLGRKASGQAGLAATIAGLGSSEYAAEKAKASSGGGGGGMCCFIFLEARYGNGTMDAVVRKFRDENMTQRNKRGYYKLSEVLVPVMRKSKVAKFLVRTLMTDPLVAYGKAHYGTGSKLGLLFKPVVNFWLKAFDYLGQDHEFIRENGEVV